MLAEDFVVRQVLVDEVWGGLEVSAVGAGGGAAECYGAFACVHALLKAGVRFQFA